MDFKPKSPELNENVTVILETYEEWRLFGSHMPLPLRHNPLPEVVELPCEQTIGLEDLGYVGLNLLTHVTRAETDAKRERMKTMGGEIMGFVMNRLPDLAPKHFKRKRTRNNSS